LVDEQIIFEKEREKGDRKERKSIDKKNKDLDDEIAVYRKAIDDEKFAYLIINALNNAISVSKPNKPDEFTKFTKKWLTEAPSRLLKPSPSISPSDVEDQTIRFFETHYRDKLKIDFTTVITYRDIVNEINRLSRTNENINQVIYDCGQELFGDYGRTCILDLDLAVGEDWDRDYSTEDKIHIALFLLNYFFPSPSGDYDSNTKFLSYMTFDADSNIPSKIFGLLDQVINLVTPLNISDSATGEAHLVSKQNKRYSSKNCYKFPVNTSNELRYMYTGNLFTEDKGVFYIDKEGVEEYGEANRYKFNVNFASCTSPSNVATISFDTDHKSGPSVNYLANVANDNRYAYPGKKMADLTAFISDLGKFGFADKKVTISQILFDIKRCGDWEQCNAAFFLEKTMNDRVILCSLDRLCSLYSRCIGNRTIWHHGPHLKLYRFPKNMTPEQVEQMRKSKEERDYIILNNKLTVITNLVISPDLFNTDINTIQFILPIKQGRSGPTKSYEICVYIATITIKIIYSKIIELFEKIRDLTTSNSAEIDEKIFKPMSELCGDTINEKNISIFSNNLSKFESIIKGGISGTKLPKSSIFLYNGNDICDLYELLFEIESFVAENVRTQSILIKNYAESLITRKFFEHLKNVKNIISLVQNPITEPAKKHVSAIIDRAIGLGYEETMRAGNRKLDNIEYYNGIQNIIFNSGLLDALNNITQTVIISPVKLLRGGFISKNVGGGKSKNPKSKSKKTKTESKSKKTKTESKSKKMRQRSKKSLAHVDDINILDNLESDLTDRFMILSSELYRHKISGVAGSSGMQVIMEEFEYFCDNALLLFKNSYNLLYELNNSIRVNDYPKWTKLTKSYTLICLFFYIFRKLVYIDSTDGSINLLSEVNKLSRDYSGKVNYKLNSDFTIFKHSLLGLFYAEEYNRFNIGDEFPILLYQNQNDALITTMIGSIVEGLRRTPSSASPAFEGSLSNQLKLNPNIIDNLSIFIFEIFFGIESLFRLVIFEWTMNSKISNSSHNLNDYGYTDIGTSILASVAKNIRLFSRNLDIRNLGSENLVNRQIFINIGILLNNTMLLIFDPTKLVTNLNSINRIKIGGGSNKKRGSIKLRKVSCLRNSNGVSAKNHRTPSSVSPALFVNIQNKIRVTKKYRPPTHNN
jgi:hypothetical protein